MSKLAITALKESKYHPEYRKGPLLICDILGFTNHTKNIDIQRLAKEIINILKDLDSISEKDFELPLFKKMESLHSKLKDDWPTELKIETLFFLTLYFFTLIRISNLIIPIHKRFCHYFHI